MNKKYLIKYTIASALVVAVICGIVTAIALYKGIPFSSKQTKPQKLFKELTVKTIGKEEDAREEGFIIYDIREETSVNVYVYEGQELVYEQNMTLTEQEPFIEYGKMTDRFQGATLILIEF